MLSKEKQTRGHERFPAFSVRDFRIFWTGQVISFSGTWMQSTAQGWLVYMLTQSPFSLGLVAAAASLPVLLFTLIGGVVADRFLKRKLLIITQLASMFPALCLGVLTELQAVAVWQIVFLAAFLGSVNAFDIPARQSFLIELVQKGRLMNAIALNSAAFNGARIVGPLFAGMTIAGVGIAACFYVNALSFLAAIIALSMIRAGRDAEETRISSGTRPLRVAGIARELTEGLGFVVREKNVFTIMTLIAVFSLFGIPFVTLLPVFARDILIVGPQGLGILAASSGVGSLAASLFIAFRGTIERRGRFMQSSGLIFGISLLVFAFSRDYATSMGALVLTGWGMVSFLAVGNSFIQLSSPDALRGRVMSVYALVFLGLAPLGNALMGFASHLAGTDKAVAFGAVICFLSVLFGSRRLREIDVNR